SFETTKDTAGCRAFYRNFIVGDFFAHFAKKYYSPLDGLDSRNGTKCVLLSGIGYGIIFSSTNR
ncbi:hypothetical protein AALA80_19385, partial [Oscillospiraceae bacterium 50-60]